MTEQEKTLIEVLKKLKNKNAQSILLQSYIAENGALSEEVGEKVKLILDK